MSQACGSVATNDRENRPAGEGKAAAIAAYARQRKDVEIDVWMTEIRRRAEVRIGELSRKLDKAERGDGSLPTLPIRPHLRVDMGRATPDALDCPMFSRVDGIYPIYIGHIKTSVALAALVAGEA